MVMKSCQYLSRKLISLRRRGSGEGVLGGPDCVTFVTRPSGTDRETIGIPTSALAKELSEAGTRVVVLTAEAGIDRALVERRHGCWVVSFPAWALRTATFSPRLSWTAVLSRRGDRVMHVHGCDLTTALALLGRRAPTVLTPHYRAGSQTLRPPSLTTRLRRLPTMTLVRRSAAVICTSEAERRSLVEDFPAVAERVVVIPNGVESRAIRRARPIPGQPPTVVCIDNGEPTQRLRDVVRALREVPAPAQLVVIGDGPHREEVAAMSQALGISDRVVLAGNLSAMQTYRWFRTAAVFIAMSQNESPDMAPVEAACAGARIILSNTRSHRCIADEFLRRCATILTDGTSSAIAAEIRRHLNGSRSDTCSALDWRDVASRTADVYRTLGVAPATPTAMTGHPLRADSFA